MWHNAGLVNSTPSRPSGGRRALIVLGALVVLVALAWGAVVIAFPPAKVSAIIRAQLATALRREVRFESASASLWPPVRLTVRRPALAEPGGFAGGAAFEAAALHLDLDPFALLARRLVIRRLVLDHPTLHLLLRADGTTNFDNLAPPPHTGGTGGGAPPMDLAIRDLRLESARVLVDDVRAGRRTLIALDSRIGLSLAGGGRIETRGRTTLHDLARGPLGAARRADLGRGLAGVELVLEHRGKFDPAQKRLALERLALVTGRTALALSGVVDDPGPHARLDLRARGAGVSLGDVLGALSSAEVPALHGLSGSGRLDFDLAIAGALGPGRVPTVTGALRVTDGAFRYPGAPAAVSALGFNARFVPDAVAIPDLAARVADQPVRAQLQLTHFVDPQVVFSVQGNFDLAALGPLVAPPDVKVGGRAAVNLSARGRAKDPGTLSLSGRAALAGVSVRSPALPGPVENVTGTIDFSGTRAAVRALSGSAGKSSFTLDATVERPLAMMAKPDSVPPASVGFALRSPYLDLAELLPPTPGPALLPNARGTGTLAIARLKQQRLDVRNVSARIEFDPTTLNAPAFSLDGYGGKVSGAASIDLRDPVTPGYTVKARVDTVQADALLSAWTPARGVMGGTLSTTLDLAGRGTRPDQIRRTLTAVGLAAVVGGQLGPAPALEAIAKLTRIPSFGKLSFRNLDLPFEVRNGQVAMREVKLHGADTDWKATGAIGFDGALDYAVSVAIPKQAVAKLGADAALAAGALSDAEGRVHIDLGVTGNARSPRVSWNSNAMRDAALGRVSSALEEQRAKLESQLRQSATQRLTGDTTSHPTNAQVLQSLADSLKKKKGRDILRDLFGPKPKPAPPPPDTAKWDSAGH